MSEVIINLKQPMCEELKALVRAKFGGELEEILEKTCKSIWFQLMAECNGKPPGLIFKSDEFPGSTPQEVGSKNPLWF